MRLGSVVLTSVMVLFGCNKGNIECVDCEPPDTDTAIDTEDTEDTEDTVDTVDTVDTEDTEVLGCHPWDPVEVYGWTKEFETLYEGEVGTEEQSGSGRDIDLNNNPVFSVHYVTNVGSGGYNLDGFNWMNCESDGSLYQVGGSGSGNVFGSSGPQAVSGYYEDRPPRLTLPSPGDMDSIGDWNYSYDLVLTDGSGAQQPITVPTSGTYVEMGFESRYTTPAGTFNNVYHLTNEFSQDRTAVQGPHGARVVNGFSHYYYAEGIGLIYELTVDADDGHTILEKTLTSYSGL